MRGAEHHDSRIRGVKNDTTAFAKSCTFLLSRYNQRERNSAYESLQLPACLPLPNDKVANRS